MAKPSIAPSSRVADVGVQFEQQRPLALLHAHEHRRLPLDLPVKAVLRRQRPPRDPLAGRNLELGVVPASAEVVGADEADVLVAGVVEIEKGLVLRGADVDAGVEHLLAVVVAGLRIAVGAEREDAEGHLGVVERLAPGLDHLREDVAVHVGTDRALERVVVALVEDRALDREPGDRRNHARVAVAGEVVVADRPGPEVAGLLFACRRGSACLPWSASRSTARCCAIRFSRSACGSHAATASSK